METTALYTLAAKYGKKALSILTVSDHVLTGEETTAEERQTTFHDMIKLARILYRKLEMRVMLIKATLFFMHRPDSKKRKVSVK